MSRIGGYRAIALRRGKKRELWFRYIQDNAKFVDELDV